MAMAETAIGRLCAVAKQFPAEGEAMLVASKEHHEEAHEDAEDLVRALTAKES